LGISFRTAACHRQHLLAKTGAANTAGLVMFAVRAGLLNGVAAESAVPRPTNGRPAPEDADAISEIRANHQERLKLLTDAVSESRLLQQQSRAARAEFSEVRYEMLSSWTRLMRTLKV
jgi:hypothetical protein